MKVYIAIQPITKNYDTPKILGVFKKRTDAEKVAYTSEVEFGTVVEREVIE